ncbi:HEAT repeat domain-containing protein [Paenibacillus athensensis]|nr:HEAT repeat domain-containing protein [Paenibacillus athensensis]MCD1259633.1 HEAT repeat domain-containing protein [Paenibacillus athensensis]
METMELNVSEMPRATAVFTLQDDVFKVLDLLATGVDERLRSGVAEVLIVSASERAERLLLKLLEDESEQVRANACESLRNSHSPEVLRLLQGKLLRDKSSLVRGHAASAAADIARRDEARSAEMRLLMKRALEREKVLWVKVHLYRGLYLLGDRASLQAIREQLNSRSYRVRSLAGKMMQELTERVKLA